MVTEKNAERLEDFSDINWLLGMRSAEFQKLRMLCAQHNAGESHSYLDKKKRCKLCGEIKKAEKAWQGEQMKKMAESERADYSDGEWTGGPFSPLCTTSSARQ